MISKLGVGANVKYKVNKPKPKEEPKSKEETKEETKSKEETKEETKSKEKK